MATINAVLLQAWCQRNNKTEMEFFQECATDQWSPARWMRYWKAHGVLHPTARAFLLKEMHDDPRANAVASAS